MNNRLVSGSLSLAAVFVMGTGCTSPAKRNAALYSGGQASIVEATQEAVDSSSAQGGALGSLPRTEKRSPGDRLLAPFRSVGNSLRPKTRQPENPDPISLSNESGAATPELLLATARVIASSGNLDEAKSLYEQALVAYPDDRDVLIELARINNQLGNTQEASNLFRQVVEAHPNDAVVFNDVGLFHLQLQNWDYAVNAFSRAVELDGSVPLYRNNLANLWVILGEDRRALNELMAVHPRPRAHYNLGFLLHRHRRTIQAIEQFELAFAADERFVQAYEMRNQLIRELQQQQSRNERYEQVMQVSYLSEGDGAMGDSASVALAEQSPLPFSDAAPQTTAGAPAARRLTATQIEYLASLEEDAGLPAIQSAGSHPATVVESTANADANRERVSEPAPIVEPAELPEAIPNRLPIDSMPTHEMSVPIEATPVRVMPTTPGSVPIRSGTREESQTTDDAHAPATAVPVSEHSASERSASEHSPSEHSPSEHSPSEQSAETSEVPIRPVPIETATPTQVPILPANHFQRSPWDR